MRRNARVVRLVKLQDWGRSPLATKKPPKPETFTLDLFASLLTYDSIDSIISQKRSARRKLETILTVFLGSTHFLLAPSRGWPPLATTTATAASAPPHPVTPLQRTQQTKLVSAARPQGTIHL